jgi:hypothetical protein
MGHFLTAWGPLITGGFALLAVGLAWWLARKQRTSAISQSLYHEIGESAGRCANDLRSVRNGPVVPLTADWVRRRLPLDTIIFRAVSGDLGLLKPRAVSAVIQFYLRLAAVSQAMETVASMRERAAQQPSTDQDREDFDWIVERLQSCLAPA